MKHWFWLILVTLTSIWYVLITMVVAFRGAGNIRDMLFNMKQEKKTDNQQSKTKN